MTVCAICGESIPAIVSKCSECEHETGLVSYPDDPDWWDEKDAQRLVFEAESETVSLERLTSQETGFLSRLFSDEQLQKRRSYDRPIIGYLNYSEVPHYILLANDYVFIRDRKESRYLRDERSAFVMMADDGSSATILITDERILVLIDDPDGDALAAAPINKIVDIEARVSRPAHQEWPVQKLGGNEEVVFKLKLTTVTAKFEIYLDPETERSKVNSVVRFIEDLAVTSDQSRSLPGENSQAAGANSSSSENQGEVMNPQIM